MLYKNTDKRLIWEQNGNSGFELAVLDAFTMVELFVQDEIPAHSVPFYMTFYVVNGSGQFVLAGEPVAVEAGDVIRVEPGLSRGWRNTGTEMLKLLALRQG
jgi:quercetin dioxygenase-like cupin family protein